MIQQEPKLITGQHHTDERGTISFVNDFDMSEVKRFYVIQNADTEVKRGWRGHKMEQRWFNVIHGEFLVRLVKIDDWVSPDKRLPIVEFVLSAENNEVLHIPIGYASCLQATKINSKLNVFADYGLENASNDNYLYDSDYFN